MADISAVIAAESEDIRASLSEMCLEAGIKDITFADGRSLRRVMADKERDIVIAVLPFAEEFGADCVSFLSRSYDAHIIVFSPSKVYDELCGKLAGTGALILPKNASRTMTVNVLRSTVHGISRLELLRAENKTLMDAVSEMKLVSRAKCVLIEYLRISEKEAHKQMQKRAMDKRITLSEAAADILKTYEYNK